MTADAGGSGEVRGDVERAVPEEPTYVHGGAPKAGPASTQETRTGVGRGRREGGERSMVPREKPTSYYGKPVVKPPVWTWEIPTYFFTGGLGGASATFALAADLTGNRELARRSWLIAFGALSVSPLLLTSDLGKPLRFLNMLRVFKVTSPMSVGSWLLAIGGVLTVPAAASSFLGRAIPGARPAQFAAGILGLPVATYTAVLVSNTAVPVWSEARWELPLGFASSAAASAGAAALLATPPAHAGPARRLAIGGALVESAVTEIMQRRLGELGRPYREGTAGALANAAKALTLAGSALIALGARRRSRGVTGAGAVALLAGSACERWAMFKAGFVSAKDPKYTVGPQRERATAPG